MRGAIARTSTSIRRAQRLTAEGDAAWVSGDIATLIGRPPRSFEQFLSDYASAFR